MTQALQHDQTALIPGQPAAGAANISADTAASGSEHSNAVVSIVFVVAEQIPCPVEPARDCVPDRRYERDYRSGDERPELRFAGTTSGAISATTFGSGAARAAVTGRFHGL